jgi:hypothetical protein
MASLVFLHLYNLQKPSMALDGSLQSLAMAPSFYAENMTGYNPTDHPINQRQKDIFLCVESLEALERLIRKTNEAWKKSNDRDICQSVKSGVYMLSEYLAPFRMENVRPISDERIGEVVNFPAGHSARVRESMGPSV